ncbi:hypothetical protein [Deinococcus budaensis]|uniref:Uncharacterized protein n=1 Tax=Deinococcus budaensis TaxID=1665626 RepID=A0A7W8GF51_9DEIO|nr:hypothetical protein [Deinococcus budaensis]MBB5234489.1 hypothetical protein [Deinococcus budaensis]
MRSLDRLARWLRWCDRVLGRLVTVGALYALIVFAYTYSAVLADVGDTVIGPPIVQEALRAIIVIHVARAFAKRWREFTLPQRLCWALLGVGMALNLARSHFGGVPLTLSYALVHLALVGITWRLMAATRREVVLARDNARLRQEAQAADARARVAEARTAELEAALTTRSRRTS